MKAISEFSGYFLFVASDLGLSPVGVALVAGYVYLGSKIVLYVC